MRSFAHKAAPIAPDVVKLSTMFWRGSPFTNFVRWKSLLNQAFKKGLLQTKMRGLNFQCPEIRICFPNTVSNFFALPVLVEFPNLRRLWMRRKRT
jgi:hypothetical protein